MTRAGAAASSRDLPLEALRGFAAMAVVLWHFFLAFAPRVLSDLSYGLAATPLFAFVHGTGAVDIFFVLSGYVLTYRYFETGRPRILIVGALKRWFRLFLPVFLSIMLSWLLFRFHLYAYEQAGKISGSNWLASFGFSMISPFDPTFWKALKEGLIIAFHHDNNSLNPLLWTIHIELLGSYMVFALAPLIANLGERPKLLLLAVILAGLVAHFIEAFLIPFLPGVLLAFYAPRRRAIKILPAFAFILIGLVFLGYREPVGFYAFLKFLEPINGEPLRAYTGTIGAVFVMVAFLACEPLRDRLRGNFARILGRLSFPLYLVHLILICSFGSAIFALVRTGYGLGVSLLMTALILLPVVFVAASVFAILDVKWIGFVNAGFRGIKLPSERTAHGAAKRARLR